jgi:hypothetical protein
MVFLKYLRSIGSLVQPGGSEDGGTGAIGESIGKRRSKAML